MCIYLDNSATTRVDDEVLKLMDYINLEFYANPSALHRFGFQVEEKIKNANQNVADIIGSQPNEIIWTSGGTESNNMALIGIAESYKRIGNEIITTKFEHPSILNTCKYLEEKGYKIFYLSVNNNGQIDIDELKKLITDKTILVSIMSVNNEIGAAQHIDEIGNTIKCIRDNIVFHTDCVQGLGKIKINCKKSKIDLLSASAHKFHGPKGVGILYKNSKIKIKPLLFGGGQQDNLRSGTLNAIGIIGTSKALELIYSDFDNNIGNMYSLRDYLIDRLYELNDKHKDIYVNTKKSFDFAPHVISISFKGIRSEVMLHSLEEKGIYVSAGSACASHGKKKSETLTSIGLSNDLIDSTIRVSLSKYNDINDIDLLVKELDALILKLRLK